MELGDSADRSMLGGLLSRLGLQLRTICLQKALLLLSQLSVKSLELWQGGGGPVWDPGAAE